MTKEDFELLNIEPGQGVEVKFYFRNYQHNTGQVTFDSSYEEGAIFKENNWSNDFFDIKFKHILNIKIL